MHGYESFPRSACFFFHLFFLPSLFCSSITSSLPRHPQAPVRSPFLATHGSVNGLLLLLLAAARASASAQSIPERTGPPNLVCATPDCWVNHPRLRAKPQRRHTSRQVTKGNGRSSSSIQRQPVGMAWAWVWRWSMDAAASETIVASRTPLARLLSSETQGEKTLALLPLKDFLFFFS